MDSIYITSAVEIIGDHFPGLAAVFRSSPFQRDTIADVFFAGLEQRHGTAVAELCTVFVRSCIDRDRAARVAEGELTWN